MSEAMFDKAIDEYSGYLKAHYERIYQEDTFECGAVCDEFNKIIDRMHQIETRFTNGNTPEQEKCVSDIVDSNIPLSFQGKTRSARSYDELVKSILQGMDHSLLTRE